MTLVQQVNNNNVQPGDIGNLALAYDRRLIRSINDDHEEEKKDDDYDDNNNNNNNNLFQRISVAIQRFNMVLLHDGFLLSDHPDYCLLQTLIFCINFSFLALGIVDAWGTQKIIINTFVFIVIMFIHLLLYLIHTFLNIISK